MSGMIRSEDLAESPRNELDAFVHLERRARERYYRAANQARERYGDDASVWDSELDYMSAVLAAASVYGITELLGWALPDMTTQNWGDYCRQFRATAEHVSLKLLIHRSRQTDDYSVAFDAATKIKLGHYVSQIRELVAKLDISVPKRERLQTRVNALQAEIDRDRTRYEVVADLLFEAADDAGEVAKRLEPVVRLVERIGAAIGLSRRAEDERERGKRLPPPDRKQIEPPKPKGRTFDKKIDDEIPF